MQVLFVWEIKENLAPEMSFEADLKWWVHKYTFFWAS